MNELILWMGRHFSPEQYLFWTRIQCLAWTSADLVIVFQLIRYANLIRTLLGKRRHRVSYAVLAATVLPIPYLFLLDTGWQLFALELLITVPHFLLILYLIFANLRFFKQALPRLFSDPA